MAAEEAEGTRDRRRKKKREHLFHNSPSPPPSSSTAPLFQLSPSFSFQPATMAETEMKLDQSLDDIIAGNNSAPARGGGGGGASSEAPCYGCGGTGHFKRDCPSVPARGGGGGGRRPYGTWM